MRDIFISPPTIHFVLGASLLSPLHHTLISKHPTQIPSLHTEESLMPQPHACKAASEYPKGLRQEGELGG